MQELSTVGRTGSVLRIGLSPSASFSVGLQLQGVILLRSELGNRHEVEVLELAVQGQLLQICSEAGREDPVRLL